MTKETKHKHEPVEPPPEKRVKLINKSGTIAEGIPESHVKDWTAKGDWKLLED